MHRVGLGLHSLWLLGCGSSGFDFSAGCTSGFAVAVQQVKGHYKHLPETEPHLSSCYVVLDFSIQWVRAEYVFCVYFFVCSLVVYVYISKIIIIRGSMLPMTQSVENWVCIVETYSNWGKEAQHMFSRLATYLAIHLSCPKSRVLADIYGCLNICKSHPGKRP